MKTVLALTLVLLAGCAGRTAPAWQSAMEEGRSAAEAGDRTRAAACLRHAAGLASGAEAAACQAQLAVVLGAAGDAAGAEAAWRQAIDGFAASLGGNAPELAAACDALARLVAGHGRMAEAEGLLRRAFAGGGDGPEKAYRLAMLADAIRVQNRPAEAAPLYRQAVAAWEQRPAEAANLAMTLHGLAQCLPPAEARPLLERATALPVADAVRAPLLDALGAACAAVGDGPAAEAALGQALRIVATAAPAAAPDLRGRLAGLAAAAGRTQDGIALLRTAIDERRRLGSDPAALGADLMRLAALEQAAASPLAVGCWREAVAHWDAKPGPELAAALFGLADTLDGIGRSAEAVAPADRGLRTLALGGTDRQPYVSALNHLIGLCIRAGDLARAIALNDEACRIVERTLGAQDPNLATALRNGAELQRRIGNAEAAAALERRADGVTGRR